MDKTFKETIKSIRDAVLGREVRECIAQGMEYVEQFTNTAVTKAAEAVQAAEQALASKNATASSQTAAANSASAAKSSADAAAKSQTAASQSASSAKASADSAGASASASAASKNAADQRASDAKTYADNANASATAAAASKSAAAASAETSKSYADNASTSASAAANSKAAAAQSASDAKGYSDSAAASAEEAADISADSAEKLAAVKAAAEAAATSAAEAKKYSAEAGAKTGTDKTLSIKDAPADAEAVGAALAALNLTPDPTLSTEGAPADAKAVGEALAEKAEKTEVSNALSQKSDTTHTHDLSELINDLSAGTATPQDADYIITQYVGGGDTTTTYHRRPMSALWAYIKGKADAVFAAKSHTHSYAGSGSAGGSANSAVKLDTATAGSATKPVYISGGKPVACTYSLGKDVPSNAVFTDHTYTNMTAATASAAGKAGLVPAPAAGAQGKFLRGDGTWQAIAASGLSAYPVGSIYQSTSSTSPASLFGGEWEQIASERVLMGASSTHAAGSTADAGLPNITGGLNYIAKSNSNNVTFGWSGALSDKSLGISSSGYESGYQGYGADITFDASRSNAIYGKSTTVQPAAYYVHIWHRVA